MPHVTHTLHEQAIHLPSLTLVISGGRYNLWSYALCSFLQFPVTFSHNSLTTDQLCSQTQSTIFLQSYKPSVTPTAIKILSKHTNVYTSIASFQYAERTAKHYEAAVCISPIHFLSIYHPPKYIKFPTLPKLQTMFQLGHIFMVWYSHCASRIHNKGRKVACQYTASL